MANTYFNSQFIYNKHTMPVLLDCNFVVDSTNGNGLGIRNLKGPGISNVFMHTTASFTGNTHTNFIIDGISGGTSSLVVGMPISGTGIAAGTTIASITSSSAITTSLATTATNTGVTISYHAVGSPNPEPGIIVVQLGQTYYRYYGGFYGFNSPLTGSAISISGSAVLTVGAPYVIVNVGTSTLANWQAVGLSPNVTPAVGVAFTASVTGGGTGTGQVEAVGTSGITSIEAIGDPNATFLNTFGTISSVSNNKVNQPYLFFQALAPTSSSVTTAIPTAPTNNTVIGLSFYLSNSSVLVKGE